MFRCFKEFWLGSEPIEFESIFDLAQSIEHLRAATRKSVFSAMTHEEMVGTVKENRVSLQRVIPMTGNSFKPFFVGRFEEADGRVVLRGCFTIHLFSKLFMAVWFGGLSFVAIAAIFAGTLFAQAWMFLPVVIGMIGAGFGLVRVGQWLSRNDPAWLSHAIGTALRPAETAEVEVLRPAVPGPPTHLRAFAILFALAGVVHIVSGFADIPAFQTRLSNPWLPVGYLTALLGIGFLALAYGIYRQHPLAWWGGFAIFSFSVLPWAEASNQPGTIFSRIVSLVILVLWVRWWYAQRVHFPKR